MKIALVALTYEPGTAGGIETYFLDLVRTLPGLDANNQITLFVQPHLVERLSQEYRDPNLTIVGLKDSPLLKLARKLRLARLGRRWSLAARINAHHFDVVHFPFQVVQPIGITAPKILSFMDMQQEFFPQFFSAEDLQARRVAYRSSCDEADHIIAISDHTRQTLIERYEIPATKVTTVHLAYNHVLYSGAEVALAEPLPQPYFYYPAATWPHKNHERLLEAFAEFSQTHPEFSLVLSGIKKQGNNEVDAIIARLDLEDKVVRLGYLPYEQLPAVFQHAYALVFPSLFEGFGIPLLEAMASRCPVLASRTTSIPEIARKAALYFDPLNTTDIVAAMTKIADNPKLRTELITKGSQRVTQFSDVKMAKETLTLYRKVGAHHG